MVLGQVVGMETGLVGMRQHLQPLLVEFRASRRIAVDPVEYPECQLIVAGLAIAKKVHAINLTCVSAQRFRNRRRVLHGIPPKPAQRKSDCVVARGGTSTRCLCTLATIRIPGP